jgi:broad-specificity NMP kinase
MRKVDDNGVKNLLAAIVHQAIRDYNIGNPGVRSHASQFLNSEFFVDICDILGLDSSNIKDILQKRGYKKCKKSNLK